MRFGLLLSCALVLSAAPGAEILWDSYGVPHVFAADARALHRALGWAQMESHADLILKLYGEARGRAAEYWGGKEDLESDRTAWTHDLPGIAARWEAEQRPAARALLEAFAQGMNDWARQNEARIAPERRRALPVTANDVLAHCIRVIHFGFTARLSLVEGQAQRWGAAPGGSNAWAIGGKRTASGKPILVVNPHLAWRDYFLFYEAHIVAPGVDFYGATLVGNPTLSMGFNQRLGWTHTVNTHDGADLYELTLKDGGYVFDGAVKPFETREHTLKVRRPDGGFEQVAHTVRRSVHGPVVRMKEGKALALRLAGLDQPHLFEQYWDMARARSFAEWERAVRRLQMPMFTFMYADAAGHIYHLFGGRTPVRAGGDWRQWSGIVPGDSSKNLWTRTHPYSELPRWFDPPSGWLQNANDPPWTTTFPPTVRRAQFPPYMAPSGMGLRPQRSARMLMEDSSVTFDEAVEYKLSTRMEAAGRMLPELLEAAAGSPAAAVLEKWDRCADAQSRGAVLFTAFYDEYMRRTKGAIWREPWSEERPMETPRGLSDPRLAAASLEEAYKAVAKLAGSADVAWGDVHRLRLGDLDLPGNGASGEYGVFRVTAFSNPRTGKRVATGGDSFVAVVEFSRPVRARVLLSYGNSSQPGSKHRTDQLPLYSRKELRTPWFTRAEIEKNLERREALP